jgi:ATP-dependent Clp protease ATP-binding subunit ClpC
VLLDEIEKAHPDVFNILLQVLDDGILTDSLGRKVDFRNTIVIMTSNIGAREIQNLGHGIGFGTNDTPFDYNNMKSQVQDALKKVFNPEFLNRIDDVIVFKPLEQKDLYKIIDIMLVDLFKRINELSYQVDITKGAKDFLAEKGYDPKYGARPLRRSIQRYVEDPLAEEILNASPESEGATVRIKMNGARDGLSFEWKMPDQGKTLENTEEKKG